MITLFHAPRTRSTRFIFLLEELGAPYRIQTVAMRGREGGAADPANPHPHGKVPAIDDDGAVVFESAAIALYLTDRFPEHRLGPVAGEPARGAYLSWLSYYAGVMEPSWMFKYMNMEVPRPTAGWVDIGEVMAFVTATLEKGPYMLGENFSAIDILLGTTFAMFMGSPMLEKTELLEAYVQRVTERPAYARAKEREAGEQ